MHENEDVGGVSEHRRRSARRFLTAGMAALLATTGALGFTSQPASAVSDYVEPVEVAWTDNSQPTRSFPAEDGVVPVGTWQTAAGEKHTSRAYFTFDLTRYYGQRIVSARTVIGEESVNDCDKPRELELWQTENPVTAPTWKDAPTAIEKLADLSVIGPLCPASYLTTLITDVVREAIAAKQDKITLMVRIGEHENGVQWGRRMTTLGVSLDHNHAPNVPTDLGAGVACRDDLFIRTTRPELRAVVSDPDLNETGGSDQVTATFAWWPADRPSERTEFTFSSALPSGSRFQYTVPDGAMTHGRTYAFSARATDQYGDNSDWSPECRFTVDTEAPADPSVSSTDYPEGWDLPGAGGPGIPGSFTFTADSDDLAGFSYGAFGEHFVPVDASGHSVTVSYAPEQSGPQRLVVHSVDRAGNFSDGTTYQFWVRYIAPTITDADPEAPAGTPRRLTFTPNMENVVEYTYRLNGGEEITVPADADGTAQVTITPDVSDVYFLYVRSKTADGVSSNESSLMFWVPEAV
ncbi:hypothetical protein [Micromonospora avicenniae]|uniref:hypothetical protein n=1 Tax=Micromonospora avicenniae TaxID=1198245 RepID=UPI00343B3D4E